MASGSNFKQITVQCVPWRGRLKVTQAALAQIKRGSLQTCITNEGGPLGARMRTSRRRHTCRLSLYVWRKTSNSEVTMGLLSRPWTLWPKLDLLQISTRDGRRQQGVKYQPALLRQTAQRRQSAIVSQELIRSFITTSLPPPSVMLLNVWVFMLSPCRHRSISRRSSSMRLFKQFWGEIFLV